MLTTRLCAFAVKTTWWEAVALRFLMFAVCMRVVCVFVGAVS